MRSYSERLADWIADDGLTLREVADKVGCDHTTIAKWLNGTEPKGLYRNKLERLLRKHERV